MSAVTNPLPSKLERFERKPPPPRQCGDCYGAGEMPVNIHNWQRGTVEVVAWHECNRCGGSGTLEPVAPVAAPVAVPAQPMPQVSRSIRWTPNEQLQIAAAIDTGELEPTALPNRFEEEAEDVLMQINALDELITRNSRRLEDPSNAGTLAPDGLRPLQERRNALVELYQDCTFRAAVERGMVAA